MLFRNTQNSGSIKKDPALDGLRGLAILLVLFSHSANSDIHLMHGLNFAGLGKYGVFLFFVLSSYLLDKQIALALRSGEAGWRFWLNYFLRRFLRVFPLYILVLLLNFYGHQIIPAVFNPLNISEFWDHIFLREGYYIFWSIPVEFKYYFLSPLLMLVFHYLCAWRRIPMIICALLMLIVAYWVMSVSDPSAVSPLPYLIIFFTGTLIAVFETEAPKKGGKLFIITELAAYLALAAVALLSPALRHYFGFDEAWDVAELYSVMALIWGILLIAVRQPRSGLRRFFSTRLLRFYGFISFSLYLLHLPVIYFFRQSSWPSSLTFALIVLCATAVASLSFILIEKPLMKVRIYHRKL